jgi:hypothetical protein
MIARFDDHKGHYVSKRPEVTNHRKEKEPVIKCPSKLSLTVIVLLIAIFTIRSKAIKAALANPVKSLRTGG